MTDQFMKELPQQGWFLRALKAVKHCILIKASIMASWFSSGAQGATAKSDLSVSATVVAQCTVSSGGAEMAGRDLTLPASSECSQGATATITKGGDTLPLETRTDTILPAASLPDRRRFGQVVTVTY